MLIQLAQTASVALDNARLYKAAQDAAATRDDVLAIVSHDLRNPLNVVGMSAALLRNTLDESPSAPAPKCVPLVQRIERNVTRMNRLIDDLLDASRVDTRKLSVQLRPEKASVLVTDAIEGALPLAEAQKTRLQADGLDTTLVVRADRDRILQVLSNLIGNSLKFVPKEGGAITVSVALDAARARFSVGDNGPGIPAENLDHLFERYWKGSNATRDGAGLGLFIAKGIVDAHGGEIRVGNSASGGAIVRFWLQLGVNRNHSGRASLAPRPCRLSGEATSTAELLRVANVSPGLWVPGVRSVRRERFNEGVNLPLCLILEQAIALLNLPHEVILLRGEILQVVIVELCPL